MTRFAASRLTERRVPARSRRRSGRTGWRNHAYGVLCGDGGEAVGVDGEDRVAGLDTGAVGRAVRARSDRGHGGRSRGAHAVAGEVVVKERLVMRTADVGTPALVPGHSVAAAVHRTRVHALAALAALAGFDAAVRSSHAGPEGDGGRDRRGPAVLIVCATMRSLRTNMPGVTLLSGWSEQSMGAALKSPSSHAPPYSASR